MQAATFLGEDRHFEQPWSLPSEPAKQKFAPKPPPGSEAANVQSEYPGRGRVTTGAPTAIAEVLNRNTEGRRTNEADAEVRIANWETERPDRAEVAWQAAQEEVLAEPNFHALPSGILQKLVHSRYRLAVLKQLGLSASHGGQVRAGPRASSVA